MRLRSSRHPFKKHSKNNSVFFLPIFVTHHFARKSHDEATGVWQARVTSNVRFYFVIEGDMYLLLDIEKHKD